MHSLFEVAVSLSGWMVYLFTITTMLYCGLSLSWQEIIKPLTALNVVFKAVFCSFIIAPAIAWLLAYIFNLDSAISAGIILLSVLAGAPVIPKFVKIANGDVGLATGLMVLLTIVSIIFSPLVLPLMIDNFDIRPWDIARPQIVWMLIPLMIALLIREVKPTHSLKLAAVMNQISSLSMLLAVILIIVANNQALLAALGTGVFAVMTLFIFSLFFIAYYSGSLSRKERVTLGIATAERNIAAAILVASVSFEDPKVLVTVIIGALMMFIFGFVGASVLGKTDKI